jgi:hypothetical protein
MSPAPETLAGYTPDEDELLDLFVIGGGPHGLATISRLYEPTPNALYSEVEHARLHWIRKHRSNRTVSRDVEEGRAQPAKGVLPHGRFQLEKGPRVVVMDKQRAGWLGTWDTLFVRRRSPSLAGCPLSANVASRLLSAVSLAERPRHLAPPKPDLLPATSGRHQRPQVVRRDPLSHKRAGRDWRRRRPRVVQAPDEEVRLLQKHCCRSLGGSLRLTLLLCFRQRARPRRPSEATPHQPARCQRLLCALDLALCRFCPGGRRRPLLAQGHRPARHRLIGPLAHARILRRPDTGARHFDPAGLSRRGRRRVDRF